MSEDGRIWTSFDRVSAEFLRRFARAFFAAVPLAVVGSATYAGLSIIPETEIRSFKILSVLFLTLYVLFIFFSLSCLWTRFKAQKILPPPAGTDPDVNQNVPWIYKIIWRAESIIGIKKFSLDDRYLYWAFVHYALAVIMFIDETYCLSRADFAFKDPFVKIDKWELVLYTGDLLHKGIIISEALEHFDKHLSVLQHSFTELSFQSVYFLVFKVMSATLLFSVLTMLFAPAFARASTKTGKKRRK
jgi:hypothetical protein